MPKEHNTVNQLASLIGALQAERQEHLDAIAQIDATFEQFGITPSTQPRRGRFGKVAHAVVEPSTKPARKRKRKARRKFGMSGLDSIMAFVTKAGKKGATTNEVVKHWKAEGRSGDGYTALGQLVKEKKLKRQNLAGERGSRYMLP